MSKMLRTLEELKDMRKNKYTFMVQNSHVAETAGQTSAPELAPQAHNETKTAVPHSNERLFIILLIGASVLFALINGRMLVELSKMRVTTSSLAQGMGNYETKLKQFEKGLEGISANYGEMKTSVDQQVQALQSDNKKIMDKLDDVGMQNDLLRVQIKDMESTNQKLMEGYIGLNNEIKDLQTSISSAGIGFGVAPTQGSPDNGSDRKENQ